MKEISKSEAAGLLLPIHTADEADRLVGEFLILDPWGRWDITTLPDNARTRMVVKAMGIWGPLKELEEKPCPR